MKKHIYQLRIPIDLWTAARIYAARHSMTMLQLIIEAIRDKIDYKQ